MRSLVLAAAAVAALTTAPVSAADLMTRLAPEKMVAIVTAATGKPAELVKNDQGDPVVSVNTGNGYDDFILGRCDAQGCADIQMTCFFEKDPKLTLAAVNAFNYKYVNAQGSVGPDGKTYLVRSMVVEGGVTEANIKANLALYFAAADLLVDVANTQQTAAIPSGGVPVSAMAPGAASGVASRIPGINTSSNRAHRLR